MKQVIESINHKGIGRFFVVSIPDKPTSKAILDLHGLGERSRKDGDSNQIIVNLARK